MESYLEMAGLQAFSVNMFHKFFTELQSYVRWAFGCRFNSNV